jgi:hypothetical protein
MKQKKYPIAFTELEVYVMAHITRHFADFMCGDDRPDHGMGILKGYREASRKYRFDEEKPEYIEAFYSAMGKLNRKDRKIKFGKLRSETE